MQRGKEYKRQIYKPSKSIDEQIAYLKKYKNVVFIEMPEEEAKEILLRFNYINVITPFKHIFAKVDDNNNVMKDESGRHIYERKVDFKEYYDCFLEERNMYPTIVTNILDFEIHFKTIVAYHVFLSEKLPDSDSLKDFLERLKEKDLSHLYCKKRIQHIHNDLERMENDVLSYADKYCFFDRMTLGNMLKVYTCLDNSIQDDILRDMKKFDYGLGVDKVPDFIKKVFTLVSIRNCVMHGNSLEILVRFFDRRTKDLRTSSSKKAYLNLIKMFSEK